MISHEQTSARLFRRLHEEGLLVLSNAWDAGSARLIESLGAKAIKRLREKGHRITLLNESQFWRLAGRR